MKVVEGVEGGASSILCSGMFKKLCRPGEGDSNTENTECYTENHKDLTFKSLSSVALHVFLYYAVLKTTFARGLIQLFLTHSLKRPTIFSTPSTTFNPIQPLQQHSTTFNPFNNIQPYSTPSTTFNPFQQHSTPFNNIQPLQQHSTTFNFQQHYKLWITSY